VALTDKLAAIALSPFMASLAIDVAITGERIFGMAGGIAAGMAVGLLALVFWYGIQAAAVVLPSLNLPRRCHCDGSADARLITRAAGRSLGGPMEGRVR
jgi:hypothetical protein